MLARVQGAKGEEPRTGLSNSQDDQRRLTCRIMPDVCFKR